MARSAVSMCGGEVDLRLSFKAMILPRVKPISNQYMPFGGLICMSSEAGIR